MMKKDDPIVLEDGTVMIIIRDDLGNEVGFDITSVEDNPQFKIKSK